MTRQEFLTRLRAGLAGMPVVDNRGETIGKTVEGLIECSNGTISYVVIASTGDGKAGEELRAAPRNALNLKTDGITLTIERAAFEALAPLPSGDWPARA